MKKLIFCGVAVGVIALIMLVFSFSNPDNAILAINESSGKGYRELVVIKRDRTYEQIFQFDDGRPSVLNSGNWNPTAEDPNSQLFAAQANISTKDYISLKNTLSVDGKSMTRITEHLQPATFWNDPNEQTLQKWKNWRAQAKPYNPSTQ